eukprot:m.67067 g.67067  ORF g.67067 m.67067 type:complete len:156 (-) comp13619_c0_seq1:112-579(-)
MAFFFFHFLLRQMLQNAIPMSLQSYAHCSEIIAGELSCLVQRVDPMRGKRVDVVLQLQLDQPIADVSALLHLLPSFLSLSAFLYLFSFFLCFPAYLPSFLCFFSSFLYLPSSASFASFASLPSLPVSPAYLPSSPSFLSSFFLLSIDRQSLLLLS